MSKIRVTTQSKEYDVYIENDFTCLKEAILQSGLKGKKFLCVTDSNVAGLYLKDIKDILEPISGGFHQFIFQAGEDSKNLKTAEEIYYTLMEHKFERSSCVLALGGGVAGDLAGFAASTFMRGVKFVQLPTSLLAQVDSSVGGKVAVNIGGAKNMAGTFYQPELVYINTKTLSTLCREEFVSGMGEVVKYGFIKDSEFLDYLHKNRQSIEEYNWDIVSYIIEKSVSIKAWVVGIDEKESGLREILNFGHTFGHAIESLSGYSIPHGKCVGFGMVCALYLSRKYGKITEHEYKRSLEVIRGCGLELSISGYEADCLYNMALKDKKVKDSKLSLILLDSMGNAYSSNDIQKEDMLEAFTQVIRG